TAGSNSPHRSPSFFAPSFRLGARHRAGAAISARMPAAASGSMARAASILWILARRSLSGGVMRMRMPWGGLGGGLLMAATGCSDEDDDNDPKRGKGSGGSESGGSGGAGNGGVGGVSGNGGTGAVSGSGGSAGNPGGSGGSGGSAGNTTGGAAGASTGGS